MPGLQDIPGDQPISCYFPGNATANAAKECAIGRAPFRGVITAIEFIPAATVTGAATNNFTLNVRNRALNGAGTQVPGSITFGNGTNAPVQAPTSLTLGAAGQLTCNPGDVLTAETAVNGTGLACPDGTIVVHFLGA
jgi:hypothetical protein